MKNLYIIISNSYWQDLIWVSSHYMAKFLSEDKDNIVVFVEKSLTYISPLNKSDNMNASWSNILKKSELKKMNDNLYIYKPLTRLPLDRKYYWISLMNQKLLYREISKIIKNFNLNKSIVISFNYMAGNLFNLLKKSDKKVKTIYYAVDDWTTFSFSLANKETIIKDELESIKNSDFVIATSIPISEKVMDNNKNCKIISHGVDISAYLNLKRNMTESIDISQIKKPIVGFIGKIEKWIDIDLIYNLAKELPDISFVLVGPSLVNIDKLITLNNIYYLGPKDKKLMPLYLSYFDIGLIPFNSMHLVKSVNPLKLYEYLAAGIPTISTPMEAVKNLESYDVYIETTVEGFKSKIQNLLSNDNEEKKLKRINFAKDNSWEEKARQLQNYCSQL